MPNRIKASSYAGPNSTFQLDPSNTNYNPYTSQQHNIPQGSFSSSQMTHQSFDVNEGMNSSSGIYSSNMNAAFHQRPSEPQFSTNQPKLVRASALSEQYPSNVTPSSTHSDSSSSSPNTTQKPSLDNRFLNVKVTVDFQTDTDSMTMNWTQEEIQSSRRLVLVTWAQHLNHLSLDFKPITPSDYIPGSPVLSCIYWEEVRKYFVTSVDLISLLECLVNAKFPVEEKNRIRRNLQSIKPLTVSKSNPKYQRFFHLIMNYENPKPRHIEKDVKVLYWSNVKDALSKVLSKYTIDHSIESMNMDSSQSQQGHPQFMASSSAQYSSLAAQQIPAPITQQSQVHSYNYNMAPPNEFQQPIPFQYIPQQHSIPSIEPTQQPYPSLNYQPPISSASSSYQPKHQSTTNPSIHQLSQNSNPSGQIVQGPGNMGQYLPQQYQSQQQQQYQFSSGQYGPNNMYQEQMPVAMSYYPHQEYDQYGNPI